MSVIKNIRRKYTVAKWDMRVKLHKIGRSIGLIKDRNVLELKYGDKVVINENCRTPYIGRTGIILDVDEDTMDDDFIYHIQFDEPITGTSEFDGTPLVPLNDEYFTPDEVNLLARK